MKTINKYGTRYHVLSPRKPNENPMEGSIAKEKYMVQDYDKEKRYQKDYGNTTEFGFVKQ